MAQPLRARKSAQYTCIGALGKGTYGTCYRVHHFLCSDVRVMKVIPLVGLSAKDVDAAFAEATLLSKIRHPHIVEYHDAWVENDHLYIVMEYCEMGDLSARLKSQPMKESELWGRARDVTCGLEYLHSKRVMHRDIKPSNLFLHAGKTVIGDFGLGRHLAPASLARTQVGTPLYFSPEVCQEKPYGLSSDVWAFGCVLYEMATGAPPHVAGNQVALAHKICNEPPSPLPASCSPALRALIQSTLRKDAAKRPSMLECFQVASSCCSGPMHDSAIIVEEGQRQRSNMLARCKEALQQLQLADGKLRKQSERISELEAELRAARAETEALRNSLTSPGMPASPSVSAKMVQKLQAENLHLQQQLRAAAFRTTDDAPHDSARSAYVVSEAVSSLRLSGSARTNTATEHQQLQVSKDAQSSPASAQAAQGAFEVAQECDADGPCNSIGEHLQIGMETTYCTARAGHEPSTTHAARRDCHDDGEVSSKEARAAAVSARMHICAAEAGNFAACANAEQTLLASPTQYRTAAICRKVQERQSDHSATRTGAPHHNLASSPPEASHQASHQSGTERAQLGCCTRAPVAVVEHDGVPSASRSEQPKLAQPLECAIALPHAPGKSTAGVPDPPVPESTRSTSSNRRSQEGCAAAREHVIRPLQAAGTCAALHGVKGSQLQMGSSAAQGPGKSGLELFRDTGQVCPRPDPPSIAHHGECDGSTVQADDADAWLPAGGLFASEGSSVAASAQALEHTGSHSAAQTIHMPRSAPADRAAPTAQRMLHFGAAECGPSTIGSGVYARAKGQQAELSIVDTGSAHAEGDSFSVTLGAQSATPQQRVAVDSEGDCASVRTPLGAATTEAQTAQHSAPAPLSFHSAQSRLVDATSATPGPRARQVTARVITPEPPALRTGVRSGFQLQSSSTTATPVRHRAGNAAVSMDASAFEKRPALKELLVGLLADSESRQACFETPCKRTGAPRTAPHTAGHKVPASPHSRAKAMASYTPTPRSPAVPCPTPQRAGSSAQPTLPPRTPRHTQPRALPRALASPGVSLTSATAALMSPAPSLRGVASSHVLTPRKPGGHSAYADTVMPRARDVVCSREFRAKQMDLSVDTDIVQPSPHPQRRKTCAYGLKDWLDVGAEVPGTLKSVAKDSTKPFLARATPHVGPSESALMYGRQVCTPKQPRPVGLSAVRGAHGAGVSARGLHDPGRCCATQRQLNFTHIGVERHALAGTPIGQLARPAPSKESTPHRIFARDQIDSKENSGLLSCAY